jgi:hypothetical protein
MLVYCFVFVYMLPVSHLFTRLPLHIYIYTIRVLIRFKTYTDGDVCFSAYGNQR